MSPSGRAQEINEQTIVRIIFREDLLGTIRVHKDDTFDEVFQSIYNLLDCKIPRDMMRLETEAPRNSHENELWYDEPDTRVRLFSEILEVTQEVRVIQLEFSYQTMKANHIVNDILVHAFTGQPVSEIASALIKKTETFSQIVKHKRESLDVLKRQTLQTMVERNASKLFELM